MRTALSCLVVIATLGVSAPSRAVDDGGYSLDELERQTNPRGRLICPKLDMVRHKGGDVRYHKPVLVYRDFRNQLVRFEELLVEVATEVYGRAPRRIRHMGTYNCRRIRKIPGLLSEHSLGNAIDIEGFDFGPARGEERELAPHRRLTRSFQVRIDKHWDNERGINAVHAQFLRTLSERLIEDDTFRVLLGPAFPGHQDHFHFDMAPYRLIEL